jgi:hypothetical protein
MRHEIDQILNAKKEKKGEIKYQIKWAGVDEKGKPFRNSWLSYSFVRAGAKELLKEFYESNPKAPRPKAWLRKEQGKDPKLNTRARLAVSKKKKENKTMDETIAATLPLPNELCLEVSKNLHKKIY